MEAEIKRSRSHIEEVQQAKSPPVLPITSFPPPCMEGDSIAEMVSRFAPVVDGNTCSFEHEVTQYRAPPVATMEGQHGFQDLSSFAPLMQEFVSRTVDMERRHKEAEKERITSEIVEPN